MEKVLAARGPAEHRFYLLKYKGYGPEHNKWSPDQWCTCSAKITEFCRENGVAVEDMMPEGPNPLLGKKQGYCYRCIWCNNFYKTSGALKGHHSRKVSDPLGCKCKPKSKSGTLSEKAVKRLRRKEAQKNFGHVCMEGTELENVLYFTYLGSNFEADGDCEQDVKIRMAIAKSTFGKLMEIWKAEEISLKQKLRSEERSCNLDSLFRLRHMGDATKAGGLTERLECQVLSHYHRQRDLTRAQTPNL